MGDALPEPAFLHEFLVQMVGVQVPGDAGVQIDVGFGNGFGERSGGAERHLAQAFFCLP